MVAGRVYIVITGFSGFAGVVDNPTEFIAKNLPAYLAERGRALPGESGESKRSCGKGE